jgi:hypothetical protein
MSSQPKKPKTNEIEYIDVDDEIDIGASTTINSKTSPCKYITD